MNLLAVFAGGLIGTALRLGIDAALPHAGDQFPWSTLIINVAAIPACLILRPPRVSDVAVSVSRTRPNYPSSLAN